MLDNALIKIIRETIIAQEAVASIPGLPIKQAFQPTQQGVNVQPTAYLHKTGDRRIGFPERRDVYDADSDKTLHTETQQMETTFQISTLSTQDPSDTEQYTASDILNFIAYILQSEHTIESFAAQGLGILAIKTLPNPYFGDDRARYEASPYLEFITTHKQIVTSEFGVVQSVEFAMYPV